MEFSKEADWARAQEIEEEQVRLVFVSVLIWDEGRLMREDVGQDDGGEAPGAEARFSYFGEGCLRYVPLSVALLLSSISWLPSPRVRWARR